MSLIERILGHEGQPKTDITIHKKLIPVKPTGKVLVETITDFENYALNPATGEPEYPQYPVYKDTYPVTDLLTTAKLASEVSKLYFNCEVSNSHLKIFARRNESGEWILTKVNGRSEWVVEAQISDFTTFSRMCRKSVSDLPHGNYGGFKLTEILENLNPGEAGIPFSILEKLTAHGIGDTPNTHVLIEACPDSAGQYLISGYAEAKSS